MEKRVKYYEIIDYLDIAQGDILDVSSDLLRILLNCRRDKEIFDPDLLINSIQKKVTKEGTILIRTFSWDFCHGMPFDYYYTPSQVGSLGNYALKRKDFKRTKHPIYSFAVWGKHKDYLCGLDNISAWGSDSPFAFITDKKGKQLMLGATMANSFTYPHYIEEKIGVHYRYLKNFTGKYIDEYREEKVKTYAMNVRDLDLDIQMAAENLAPKLYENDALCTTSFDEVSISVVDLRKAYDIVQEDIINNRSRGICTYKGQEDEG